MHGKLNTSGNKYRICIEAQHRPCFWPGCDHVFAAHTDFPTPDSVAHHGRRQAAHELLDPATWSMELHLRAQHPRIIIHFRITAHFSTFANFQHSSWWASFFGFLFFRGRLNMYYMYTLHITYTLYAYNKLCTCVAGRPQWLRAARQQLWFSTFSRNLSMLGKHLDTIP